MRTAPGPADGQNFSLVSISHRDPVAWPRGAAAGAQPRPASGARRGPVFRGQGKAGLGVDRLAWCMSVLQPRWPARTTEPTATSPRGWRPRCRSQRVARPAASLLPVLTWPPLRECVPIPLLIRTPVPRGQGPSIRPFHLDHLCEVPLQLQSVLGSQGSGLNQRNLGRLSLAHAVGDQSQSRVEAT